MTTAKITVAKGGEKKRQVGLWEKHGKKRPFTLPEAIGVCEAKKQLVVGGSPTRSDH